MKRDQPPDRTTSPPPIAAPTATHSKTHMETVSTDRGLFWRLERDVVHAFTLPQGVSAEVLRESPGGVRTLDPCLPATPGEFAARAYSGSGAGLLSDLALPLPPEDHP